jgi:mannosyltransferase
MSHAPKHLQGSKGVNLPSGHGRPWAAPTVIGLLAFCAAFIGSWIPSFWDDEVATISAAGRSPGQLLMLLQSVDAVHGLYYFLMHYWTSVFGFSELAMRLPSAAAVALACAGTVVIGRRMGSDRIGLAAGFVLALLPRMVWAGTEARQSAFTALFAVALTLLLIRAWQSNRVGDWLLYGVCAVLGVWMFMFFALAVASHAAAALFLKRRPIATLATSAAVGAVVLPFLLYALGQKAQVDWIQDRSLAQNLMTAAVKQFFYGDDRPTENLPPQWVLGFVVLLGVLEIALVVWGLRAAARNSALRPLAVLGLTGVAVPMAGLLLVSVAAQPVYVARYLTFTGPAFALLVGLGISHLPVGRTWVKYVVVAALAFASLVPQLTLKSVVNEPPDTERQLADLVDDAPGKPAAIVYLHPHLRDMALAYPEDFDGVKDLSLQESPEDSGTLWGENRAVSAEQLAGQGEVWFVGDGKGAPNDLSAFAAAGCAETRTLPYQRVTMVVFDCR